MNTSANKILADLKELYDQLDTEVRKITFLNSERLNCKHGCHQCCLDDLSVFEIEALNIRQHFAGLLMTSRAHPQGSCAFLDRDGGCRIYPQRPYVCRTQGLPLRWIEANPQSGWTEFRDICGLNEAGIPVEQLPPAHCWEIGHFEGRLAELQVRFGAGRLTRIKLRSLFDPETKF